MISQLEAEGLLKRIKVEVDGNCEMGAITRRVFDQRGPALLFENVKKSSHPYVVGLMDTYERYATGIGCPSGDVGAILDKVFEATRNTIPPVIVQDGPCQEIINTGNEINLDRFAAPLWHEKDGGPYLGTLGLVITKDPETGIRNAGIYRLMQLGPNRIGFNATQQSGIPLRKHEAMNKPMPVAVAIGLNPATLAGICVRLPYGQDEFDVVGGIMGQPLKLVRCQTVALEVPADAEIVIEGEVSPSRGAWIDEGPFGEFTGYYGQERKAPFINVNAITYRKDAIVQATLEGRPPSESTTLRTIGHTVGLKRFLLSTGIPGIKDVFLSDEGCANFIAVVSLDKQFYSGQAQQVIHAVWSSGMPGKFTVVTDGDVDVYNLNNVMWSVSTRVQPHRDVIITGASLPTPDLDPSMPPELRRYPFAETSKMGIDATTKFKGFDYPDIISDESETIAMVDKRWEKYGID
jgi:UbiD family decarboxylase